MCVLSTASRAEAEAGAEAGAAGREAWEGSAARRFREGPLEQLRGCHSLRYLDLSENKDVSGGLDALAGCTELQRLVVAGAQLDGGQLGQSWESCGELPSTS